MLLSELKTQEGLSDEQIAERLNAEGITIRRGDRKGEPLLADDVAKRGDWIPPSWASVLSVERPPEKEPQIDPATGEPVARRRRERTPTRPEGAKVQVVIEAGAEKRIAGAYKFVGAALAAGAGSQGVAHVWSDSSDKIAELWIEAAKENPWAAKFVTLMSAGGPMGDLAAGHLYLAGATFYVLGAAIPGGDALFAKYSRYRPTVTPTPPPPPPAESVSSNGVVEEPLVNTPPPVVDGSPTQHA